MLTVIGLSRSREQDIDAVREALKVHRIHAFTFSWQLRRFTASINCGWKSSRCWKQLEAAIRYAKKIFLAKLNSHPRMQDVRSYDFLV